MPWAWFIAGIGLVDLGLKGEDVKNTQLVDGNGGLPVLCHVSLTDWLGVQGVSAFCPATVAKHVVAVSTKSITLEGICTR
ncbi:hypothetical protein BDZ85DRAFT_267763 [Elsinoe ampelina]|uniref:Uncharacterized protein n=1 Tax=Elsinoe ampelina TaxID=302913 RepID=A0A6A6G2K7_9PEZI|nr:hypothetical protein BDZ85DRAFT_267763 [Elsinoe ampelina]